MKAINIIAYTEDDSQIEAIEAVIKAFKIKYIITKTSSEFTSFAKSFPA